MARLNGFTKQQLLDVYYTMVLARELDNRMLTLIKQGKGFFHMGCSGHESAQIAAALTISLRSNKILLSLMVLPLYIPILIYGTNAVNNSYFGISYQGEITMMILIFILFLLITPFTCAKALLVALD